MVSPVALNQQAIPLALLDALGEGVALANTEGRIVFSNRAAERILGVRASEGLPATWGDYYGIFLSDEVTPFPPDQYPLVRALRGEETDQLKLFIRNPGVPQGVLIVATGRPLRDASGAITGASVVFRDITTLRRTERELRAAQQRERELSAFIVHDLKSPLTSIVVSAQMLLDSPELAHDGETVEAILNSALSMHRMVMDLLDVHVSEDSELELERTEVDLHALFTEIQNEMLPSALHKQQRIVIADTPGLSPLHADREILIRVLKNLVDNCIKYGPTGGSILLGATAKNDQRVLITVLDEGPGVPEPLREHIFEKYAQIERNASRSRDSRGLGLRFCRLAVAAHGGRIWVENNTPKGARFCLELPLRGPASAIVVRH